MNRVVFTIGAHWSPFCSNPQEAVGQRVSVGAGQRAGLRARSRIKLKAQLIRAEQSCISKQSCKTEVTFIGMLILGTVMKKALKVGF